MLMADCYWFLLAINKNQTQGDKNNNNNWLKSVIITVLGHRTSHEPNLHENVYTIFKCVGLCRNPIYKMNRKTGFADLALFKHLVSLPSSEDWLGLFLKKQNKKSTTPWWMGKWKFSQEGGLRALEIYAGGSLSNISYYKAEPPKTIDDPKWPTTTHNNVQLHVPTRGLKMIQNCQQPLGTTQN